MTVRRFWSCWSHESRSGDISPCGYLENRSDRRCEGCADNPNTQRRWEIEAEVQETARRWAGRWGNG